MSADRPRRRPRRAVRDATGGDGRSGWDVSRGGPPDPTLDDLEPDPPATGDEDEHARWLREQRPPHWE